MEKRCIRPDGSIVWVRLIVSKLMLTKDNKLSYICLIQDITKEKLSEINFLESERSKKIILSHLPGLAYRCRNDKDWTMEYVSSGCLELTGYLPEALLYNKELSFNEIIAPDYREDIQRKWEYSIKNDLPFKYEYEIITAQGDRKWVYETGQGVFDKYGKVVALEGVILDISDRKEIEDNLMYISIHDSLTGLHNRPYFESVLKKDMDEHQGKKALIGINLNSLQVLTLTYGFYYVQDLIKKIAHSLELYISENHLLFRTNETRFVFYVKDYQDLEELIKFSEIIRDGLEPIISMERIIGGIGVYEIKGNDSHIADILKKLLIASEKAMLGNLSGSLGISSYDKEIEKEIMREDNVRRELYNIVDNKNNSNLFLEFQPILDLKSNKISGFEALTRIDSDKLGRITPLEFIPIAEKTKLIIPIGERILKYSLDFLKHLNNLGYREIV
jgi:PAS domain S-box-containing protein